MRSALEREFGVPVRWVEPQSRNTHENAARSAEILQRREDQPHRSRGAQLRHAARAGRVRGPRHRGDSCADGHSERADRYAIRCPAEHGGLARQLLCALRDIRQCGPMDRRDILVGNFVPLSSRRSHAEILAWAKRRHALGQTRRSASHGLFALLTSNRPGQDGVARCEAPRTVPGRVHLLRSDSRAHTVGARRDAKSAVTLLRNDANLPRRSCRRRNRHANDINQRLRIRPSKNRSTYADLRTSAS